MPLQTILMSGFFQSILAFFIGLFGGGDKPVITEAELPIRENCALCHIEESWSTLRNPIDFDHDQTLLPLRGVHASLDCAVCHTGETYDEVHDFASVPDACWACHLDVHQGSLGDDCNRCHQFDSWNLTRARQIHQATAFPLIGSHLAVDCSGCHVNQELHQYRQTTTECFICHQDAMEDAFADEDHPRSTACEACHQPTHWEDAGQFVHLAFPIRIGHHSGIDCLDCHTSPDYSTYSCAITCHFSGCADYYGEEEAHRNAHCPDVAEVECYHCHSRGR